MLGEQAVHATQAIDVYRLSEASAATALVIGLCILVGMSLMVGAIKMVATSIARLAEAVENTNRTRAVDLEAERDDIRDEIRNAIRAVTEQIGGKVDDVAGGLSGEVSRLDEDVDRLNRDVIRAAGAVEHVDHQIGIAGSRLWEGGLEGRVDNTKVRLATGTTGTQPAVVDRPTPPPPAPTQAPLPPRQQAARQPEIPGATPPVQAFQAPSPDEVHEFDPIGDRTRRILVTSDTAKVVDPQSYDRSFRRAVWDAMLAEIRHKQDDNIFPWDLHRGAPISGRDGAFHTHYQVCRARWNNQFNGIYLPKNMHELWIDLRQDELWATHGPGTHGREDLPQ